LKKIPNTLTTEEISALASKSHGYVGADLAAICREAGLKAVKRCIKENKRDFVNINVQDMEASMAEIRPSAMREVSILPFCAISVLPIDIKECFFDSI
jgi:SpoVK/Ycf46/Vps4 family AAA+-type ATPase